VRRSGKIGENTKRHLGGALAISKSYYVDAMQYVECAEWNRDMKSEERE
jgi:hypothetical protein